MALRPHYDFLQQLAWQRPATNALQYNIATPGPVIPIVFGVIRVPVNVIAFGGYQGPGGGKKGKGVGPLPIGGTNTVGGKGGGGGKGKGKSKKGPQDFSIDVDMGVCQGPISQIGKIYVNASVADFPSVGLNLYVGTDGQAPDGTMAALGFVVGYSGTSHFTGTPLDLGMSPVLPNMSVEAYGFFAETFPSQLDANAGLVVSELLTNERYGIEFPAQFLDPNLQTTYGNYTVAAGLPVSVILDAQQKGTEWLDGMARLTNTAVVCSGSLLKLIPYGDLALTNNGVTWTPPNNLTPVASLTDDDFLPWHPRNEDGEPATGEDDPVILTRVNPADRDNWLTIQFRDRSNFYNDQAIPVFDQGFIDQYGRRDGEVLPGRIFCSATAAQISAQLFLQRRLYVNTCRFKCGWQHGLIEPMDVVLLTHASAKLYQAPFRITSRERDANGDLTFSAETISPGTSPPPPPPPPFVDGTGGASGLGVSTVTANITTHNPNDVILVIVQAFQTNQILTYNSQGYIPPRLGTVSSPTLGTLRARSAVITTKLNDDGFDPPWYGLAQLLWAPAPAVLTNEPITVTFPAGGAGAFNVVGGGIAVMAVHGAGNINSPFDPNSSLPASKIYVSPTQTKSQVQVTDVSTSNANGLIIGAAATFSQINVVSFGVPSGNFATSGDGIYQPFDGYQAECVIVAYTGSNLGGATVDGIGYPYIGSVYPGGSQPLIQDNWIMFADAISSK